MDNATIHITPVDREKPSRFAERLGTEYADASIHKEKRRKGQFFTPHSISSFMGSIAVLRPKAKIDILDPGCGTSILSCSIIENIVDSGFKGSITLTLFETDKDILPLTRIVLDYLKDWCLKFDVSLEYHLHDKDFILDNCVYLSDEGNTIFGDSHFMHKYDYVISNPPYFKLSKDDVHTRSCRSIVDGQTNIYALFMAICAKMLAKDGQMIFITPRSFASGRYFQSFRNFLFKNVQIDFIHIFNTRKDTFAKDDVLQELVITSMSPHSKSTYITISHSQGIVDLDKSQQKKYAEHQIVDLNSIEKVIYLPVNERDNTILELFRSWDGTMGKYGIQISTGPVVAYRAVDFIVDKASDDTAPLYWLHNVVKMLCYHPAPKKDKGQYIRVTDKTRSSLLPNKNYVLLRRFSSKDDNSRLVAAPYFGNMIQCEFVGFENKLNYIYKLKGHLHRAEAIGLAALLNSELFDTWFRTFNGNINVSASELRMMPLPPIDIIKEIGRKIILRNNYSIDYINNLVLEYFNIEHS